MKKILVTDDSATLRRQVRLALEKDEYVVYEAENGSDGLKVLRENPDICLAIVDLNMPVMGGIDMIQALRSDEKLKALKIFVLTTDASKELKEQTKAFGVNWIMKPFDPTKLLNGVNKVLGKV